MASLRNLWNMERYKTCYGMPLPCRVPRSHRLQVPDFLMVSEVPSVRAGCRQVIDILVIVVENSFRSSNGRSAGLRSRVLLNHFEINRLPKKSSPHGGTLESSENSDRDACGGEKRATFVARFVRGYKLSVRKGGRKPNLGLANAVSSSMRGDISTV
jgi:hypothetical protein